MSPGSRDQHTVRAQTFQNPRPGHVRVPRGTALTDMAADFAAKSDSQPQEVRQGEAARLLLLQSPGKLWEGRPPPLPSTKAWKAPLPGRSWLPREVYPLSVGPLHQEAQSHAWGHEVMNGRPMPLRGACTFGRQTSLSHLL